MNWKEADRSSLLPIARELRSSSATRTAVMLGKNVSYIKGTKLVNFLKENKSITELEAAEIGNALLRENLVTRAELQDSNKKVLRPTNVKIFDEKAFLVWNFEGSTGMRNLLLFVIVLAFFGLVLFPVWPQSAKVGVWYVSMTLLLVLIGFIVIRLVLFLIFYAVGVDFWILPNFFADDLGIVESFRPAYSFHTSFETIKETWVSRLLVSLFVAATVFWFYTQPTEFDEFVASQRAFVDELYEGTLLSDKSEKDKQQIDKVVPDFATVQKELEELEKLSEEEKKKEDLIDQKLDEILKKDEKEEEIADL